MTAPSKSKKTSDAAGAASGNVRVVVRIRPLSSTERGRGCKEIITSMNQDYGTAPAPGDAAEVLQVAPRADNKRWFEFDAVLGDQAHQSDVYQRSGAKDAVVDDIFKGYNATLLAYGQTGAGKTYTMGSAAGDSSEHAGILPRACQDLFETIQTKCDGNGRVELSYLEIYNEEIRDLLSSDGGATASNTTDRRGSKSSKRPKASSSQQLKIRETLNGEVYVSGLTAQEVKSPEEIGVLLEEASQRRVVASTAMNAVSSRSHAICSFKVSGVLEGGEKFTSKLTLVDLAGSERIKKTGAEGSRALEGIHINKSLMCLGQVVSALSDRKSKRKPPYRDSKLTRLLQDSLGGNSRTIMLACVSPADYNFEESSNTLRYATTARNIKNTATKNIVQQISPEEALKLQRENQLLKQQVAELQEALRKMSNGSPLPQALSPGGDLTTVSDDEEEQPQEAEAQLITEAKQLRSQLAKTKSELIEATNASAIELPALKVEVAKLKEQLEDKNKVEAENEELRQELEDARADAAGARMAANKLTDIMETLTEMRQDEIDRKRMQLQHKRKEKEWVDFVARILDTRTEQLHALQEDFELVIKVVESPVVYQVKPEKRGFFGRTVNREMYDPEMRETLLKEHVKFFKDRMDSIQNDIFVRVISLQAMRDRIQLICSQMEEEIGMHSPTPSVSSDMSPDHGVLAKLVDMLISPSGTEDDDLDYCDPGGSWAPSEDGLMAMMSE